MGNFFSSDTGEIWRKAPDIKKEVFSNLKQKIKDYSPNDNWNVPHVNILLIGAIGAGKSSFVNTICSIYKNSLSQKGIAGSNFTTGKMVTKQFRKHPIYSVDTKTELKFKLCDTGGLFDKAQADNEDLTFLLKGNIKDRYVFDQSSSITSNAERYNAKPEFRDRMHCVVLVCDATTLEEYPKHCSDAFKTLLQTADAEGVPRAVVLTKIDMVSKCLFDDVSKVFQSKKVAHAVDIASNLFGVPRCYIHPVKNYEKEVMLNDNINCLALMALDYILSYADEFIRDNNTNSLNTVN